MLRPVEFDAAANPRSGQSHQCRFDYLIVIYKIIVVGLVEGTLDSAAELR